MKRKLNSKSFDEGYYFGIFVALVLALLSFLSHTTAYFIWKEAIFFSIGTWFIIFFVLAIVFGKKAFDLRWKRK